VEEPFGVLTNVILYHLAVPHQDVLVDHQALHAHRSAGMDLVGADSDLGPFSVAETVGEAGGCVDEHVR
jgi:hypothetical protein